MTKFKIALLIIQSFNKKEMVNCRDGKLSLELAGVVDSMAWLFMHPIPLIVNGFMARWFVGCHEYLVVGNSVAWLAYTFDG